MTSSERSLSIWLQMTSTGTGTASDDTAATHSFHQSASETPTEPATVQLAPGAVALSLALTLSLAHSQVPDPGGFLDSAGDLDQVDLWSSNPASPLVEAQPEQLTSPPAPPEAASTTLAQFQPQAPPQPALSPPDAFLMRDGAETGNQGDKQETETGKNQGEGMDEAAEGAVLFDTLLEVASGLVGGDREYAVGKAFTVVQLKKLCRYVNDVSTGTIPKIQLVQRMCQCVDSAIESKASELKQKEEVERMKAYLQQVDPSKELHQVHRDGSCQFSSLVYVCNVAGIEAPTGVAELRLRLVTWLQEHWDFWIKARASTIKDTWTDTFPPSPQVTHAYGDWSCSKYERCLLNEESNLAKANAEWGDEFTLKCMATMLNIAVHVLAIDDQNSRKYKIEPWILGMDTTPPQLQGEVWICHYGESHYDAIIEKKGSTVDEDEATEPALSPPAASPAPPEGASTTPAPAPPPAPAEDLVARNVRLVELALARAVETDALAVIATTTAKLAAAEASTAAMALAENSQAAEKAFSEAASLQLRTSRAWAHIATWIQTSEVASSATAVAAASPAVHPAVAAQTVFAQGAFAQGAHHRPSQGAKPAPAAAAAVRLPVTPKAAKPSAAKAAKPTPGATPKAAKPSAAKAAKPNMWHAHPASNDDAPQAKNRVGDKKRARDDAPEAKNRVGAKKRTLRGQEENTTLRGQKDSEEDSHSDEERTEKEQWDAWYGPEVGPIQLLEHEIKTLRKQALNPSKHRCFANLFETSEQGSPALMYLCGYLPGLAWAEQNEVVHEYFALELRNMIDAMNFELLQLRQAHAHKDDDAGNDDDDEEE